MAIKAAAEVTITDDTDLDSLVTWYALTSSTTAPSAPTTTRTADAVADWQLAEPSFDPAQGTFYLYTVQQTRWKDGSCEWGAVQLSSSYEQAKQAWNRANTVSANLEVANGRITSLVDGLEQSSYFQQTEDGFTFTVDSAISTVAQAAGNAQDSADNAATAAAAAAQAAEDASRVARDYLTFQNGELTIGTSESDIRSVLTNVKFAFKTDAGDIAYFGLNNDGIWQMHIATAYMDDMLRFGDYAWIKRDNGNMSIKWLGA